MAGKSGPEYRLGSAKACSETPLFVACSFARARQAPPIFCEKLNAWSVLILRQQWRRLNPHLLEHDPSLKPDQGLLNELIWLRQGHHFQCHRRHPTSCRLSMHGASLLPFREMTLRLQASLLSLILMPLLGPHGLDFDCLRLHCSLRKCLPQLCWSWFMTDQRLLMHFYLRDLQSFHCISANYCHVRSNQRWESQRSLQVLTY